MWSTVILYIFEKQTRWFFPTCYAGEIEEIAARRDAGSEKLNEPREKPDTPAAVCLGQWACINSRFNMNVLWSPRGPVLVGRKRESRKRNTDSNITRCTYRCIQQHIHNTLPVMYNSCTSRRVFTLAISRILYLNLSFSDSQHVSFRILEIQRSFSFERILKSISICFIYG